MSVRWSALCTALWLGVHLVLLVALGFGFVWPLVDPQAVERDPWHDHLVLGATQAARAQALAAHLHAGLAWHDHPALAYGGAVTPDASEAHVVVVASSEGAAGLSLGQAATRLALPPLLTLACLVLVAQTPRLAQPLARLSALRRLDPPPRCLPG